ncbi:probable histone H2A variant 1 [Sorghum bicolor]|uniref:probable histone H2A variant 1 n=1 Tax=Sorghum bicolor TaxID=4558 RepID=UPI000B4240A7|nr:probable histone H2A variant 1 [Sorghum bicolor]|eukprot:XP_021317636.1 probable histone H2A variant 1 [Sorghum bicolor]
MELDTLIKGTITGGGVIPHPQPLINKSTSRWAASSMHACVSASAIIYTAAILEYLTAKVLEMASNARRDLKAKSFTPWHQHLANRRNEELDTLIKGTIASGDVIPHIHKALSNKTAKE